MFKKMFLSAIFAAMTLTAQAETVTQILVDNVLKVPYQYDDLILIDRVQTALNKNKQVCNFKNEEQLAASATLVTMELRKSSQIAEVVDIIEGLNAMLSGVDKPINCADALGLYVGSRKQGMTHSEAVAGGRILMKAMYKIK